MEGADSLATVSVSVGKKLPPRVWWWLSSLPRGTEMGQGSTEFHVVEKQGL